jgi:hypothetical protein
MNRALGLDLGQTKCWNWTWDKLGIVTGPEMNRALVVTQTHVSYAIGPGMNTVGSTSDRCEVHWTWDEQGIRTGPGMNRPFTVTQTHMSYTSSDKIHTASCTYVHVLSLCHLYPLHKLLASWYCPFLYWYYTVSLVLFWSKNHWNKSWTLYNNKAQNQCWSPMWPMIHLSHRARCPESEELEKKSENILFLWKNSLNWHTSLDECLSMLTVAGGIEALHITERSDYWNPIWNQHYPKWTLMMPQWVRHAGG